MHLSSSQAFNSSRFLNRSRGVKKRSLTSPTWFSTCPFSQARRWRAGDWVDQIVAAHLQETAIVETPFTDEDRLYSGLHVVVDAAAAGALEQRERPIVGIEHHLLRLSRIRPGKQHPAVAKPNVSDLHDHGGAAQQDHLVAPVELVGFAWGKTQRHIGGGRRRPGSAGSIDTAQTAVVERAPCQLCILQRAGCSPNRP
jgi:hypothetical protein